MTRAKSVGETSRLILMGCSIALLLVVLRGVLAWAGAAGPWPDPGVGAWLTYAAGALACALLSVRALSCRSGRGSWEPPRERVGRPARRWAAVAGVLIAATVPAISAPLAGRPPQGSS